MISAQVSLKMVSIFGKIISFDGTFHKHHRTSSYCMYITPSLYHFGELQCWPEAIPRITTNHYFLYVCIHAWLCYQGMGEHKWFVGTEYYCVLVRPAVCGQLRLMMCGSAHWGSMCVRVCACVCSCVCVLDTCMSFVQSLAPSSTKLQYIWKNIGIAVHWTYDVANESHIIESTIVKQNTG